MRPTYKAYIRQGTQRRRKLQANFTTELYLQNRGRNNKTRIEEQVEDKLQGTQYGFRKGRSTSQPLFLIRRMIEIYEATEDEGSILFQDWEKPSTESSKKRFERHSGEWE